MKSAGIHGIRAQGMLGYALNAKPPDGTLNVIIKAMIPISELKTKRYLIKMGYDFIRSGRSFGLWDFIAFNKKEIIFIQAKLRQWPDRTEMTRIYSFQNYPRKSVKLQIWLWQKGERAPRIREV